MNSEERIKILEMLREGKINPDEAEKLLMTSGGLQPLTPLDDRQAVIMPQGPNVGTTRTEDLPEFKNFWQWIFAAGASGFLFTGLIMTLITLPFILLCLSPLLLVGFALAALGLWSRSSHWIHIRIQDKDGTNIKLSLPFPFQFAGLIMKVVQPYIKMQTGDTTLKNIDFAMLMREMGDSLSPENPIVVAVDDNDDHVLVYIT